MQNLSAQRGRASSSWFIFKGQVMRVGLVTLVLYIYSHCVSGQGTLNLTIPVGLSVVLDLRQSAQLQIIRDGNAVTISTISFESQGPDIPGLKLSQKGILHGAPTTEAAQLTQPLKLTVTGFQRDSSDPEMQLELLISVIQVDDISNLVAGFASVGESLHQDLSTRFVSNATLTYTLVEGSLPMGTGFRVSRSGILQGVPTTADLNQIQPLNFQVQARSEDGSVGDLNVFFTVIARADLPAKESGEISESATYLPDEHQNTKPKESRPMDSIGAGPRTDTPVKDLMEDLGVEVSSSTLSPTDIPPMKSLGEFNMSIHSSISVSEQARESSWSMNIDTFAEQQAFFVEEASKAPSDSWLATYIGQIEFFHDPEPGRSSPLTTCARMRSVDELVLFSMVRVVTAGVQKILFRKWEQHKIYNFFTAD